MKCCCNRRQKFMYHRMNIGLVFVHLIMGIALCSYFGSKRPDNLQFDDWLAASGSIRDLIVGLICLVIGLAMIVICLIGFFAVCCRCCCLLVLLVPVTLVAAIVMFAIGSLAENLSRFIDDICTEVEDEISVLWKDSVDVPMCSDMCPCKSTDFTGSGYDTMTDDQLEDFNRQSLWTSENLGTLPNAVDLQFSFETKMPLFTDVQLNAFLAANSGNDLSDLTMTILRDGYGAGPFDMSNGFVAGNSATWPSGLYFGETATTDVDTTRGGNYKANTNGVEAY